MPDRNGNASRLRAIFDDYVRKHGLKSTQQRDVIVDLFIRSKGHMSIEDLLSRVRRKNPKVGYATVYRTLKLLTDCGIAAARQFGDGQTRFEVMDEAGHHDHLICVECGLILEFEKETAVQRAVFDKDGKISGLVFRPASAAVLPPNK